MCVCGALKAQDEKERRQNKETRSELSFFFSLITLIQSDNVTHSQTHSSLLRLPSLTARAQTLKIELGLHFK